MEMLIGAAIGWAIGIPVAEGKPSRWLAICAGVVWLLSPVLILAALAMARGCGGVQVEAAPWALLASFSLLGAATGFFGRYLFRNIFAAFFAGVAFFAITSSLLFVALVALAPSAVLGHCPN